MSTKKHSDGVPVRYARYRDEYLLPGLDDLQFPERVAQIIEEFSYNAWCAAISEGDLWKGDRATREELLAENTKLSADLLRLAGPPCDYPPCKGARAIEHRIHRSREGIQWLSTEVTANHPPSPSVEAWLRERGK